VPEDLPADALAKVIVHAGFGWGIFSGRLPTTNNANRKWTTSMKSASGTVMQTASARQKNKHILLGYF
jgi:hypothetical protein